MNDNNNRIIMPGQAQQPQANPFAQLMQQMQVLTNYMKQLEQGLIGLSQESHAQSLGFRMILNMFVDKGLFTTEEIDVLHKKHVQDPIVKHLEELQKKMDEAQQQQQKIVTQAEENTSAVQEVPVAPPAPVAEEKEEDPKEKVTLASEQNNVIRFPDGKE